MTFGDCLRQLREQQSLRQGDLARGAGVSDVYVCDIEKGNRKPPDIEKLRTWVAMLNPSPEEAAQLYDLYGAARNTIAPDLVDYLISNSSARDAIRRIIGQQVEYDWDMIP